MGIHDGHRQRLKDRFLSQGLSGFEPHNILELLLFYSIPRSDTNEIAHRLLNEFKTVSGVFEASVEDLCRIKGVSMHTATLIKLIPEISYVYNIDKTKDIEIVTDTARAGRYFVPRFSGKTYEEVHVMLLDDKNKITPIKGSTVKSSPKNVKDATILLISLPVSSITSLALLSDSFIAHTKSL